TGGFFTLSRLDDLRDDAHVVHLFGAVDMAFHDHPPGQHGTHAPGQDRIGAHAGEQAEQDFGQAEARLPLSYDDIEAHERFQTAAQRVSLRKADVDDVHVVAVPDAVHDLDAGYAIFQQGVAI